MPLIKYRNGNSEMALLVKVNREQYPRINLKVKEEKDNLHLDLMPF